MRIALVTDYWLPTLGGVQTAVKSLRESLSNAGHEVTVFCPIARPSADPSVVALPVSPVFRPDGYPFTWPPRRAEAVLRTEFERRGIQLVHTHSEMFAALSAISAATALGLPVVHTMHGRIDVYTASVLPLPWATVPLLALLHSRRVSHRGIRVSSGAPYTRTLAARRMWRLMLAQSRASDHVIVPSRHFADKLVAEGVRTPISVVSNGLEPSVRAGIGSPHPRTLEPGETLRVMWVGRLSPEKRPEVFLTAARGFGPGVRVDVYGDGIARRAAERSAEPGSLHGAVPQHEVLAAMRNSHLLVSSSFGFDNQPMVLLEAIAAGLPVLYCDPDLAEMIPDGGGFEAATPDAAGIASAVQMLQRDPGQLTAASAAMLAAAATVSQRADPMVAVYETALARA